MLQGLLEGARNAAVGLTPSRALKTHRDNPDPPVGIAMPFGCKLQIVLGGSANPDPYYVVPVVVWSPRQSFVRTFMGQSTDTTPKDMVTSPRKGALHIFQYCNVMNNDAASQTITIQLVFGGTTFILVKQVVPSGETLSLMNGQWYVTFRGVPIPVSSGGTGLSSVAVGALLYGNGTNPLQVLPLGTTTQILQVNAAGTAPQWVTVSNDITINASGVAVLQKTAITGQATGTVIADDDLLLTSDTSVSGNLKAMTRANFLGSLLATFASGAAVGGQFSLTGVITPNLTSNETDWNPTNFSTATRVRANPSTSIRTVNSLAGGVDGREIQIENVGAVALKLLSDDGATGTAAMRFAFTAGLSIHLWTGDSVVLRYDGTASRWKCIARSVAGVTARAYRSSSQTISTGATAKVAFNAESYDSHGWFDSTTNNRFQPLLPGKYHFSWMCIMEPPTSGLYFVSYCYKNGAEAARGQSMVSNGSADVISLGSSTLDMNGSSDYLEVFVTNAHASGRNLYPSTGQYNFFSLERVGD